MARTRRKTSLLGWLRKLLLLYLLVMVALGSWLARVRSTDWNDTLIVAAYPVNREPSGPSRDAVDDYIAQLDASTFDGVARFIKREGERYGVDVEQPVRVFLGAPAATPPPAPPAGGNVVQIMAWSLRLRYYAWREQRAQDLPRPDVRLFVVYHDPDVHEVLGHSVGLQKGLIGIVNAFASRRENSRNNIVLVHELLHTLGATDKYDRASNMPLFPDGYADPGRRPVLPQPRAEIMAGRRPLNEREAEMPDRLSQVVVGPKTAAEIRWLAAE